MRFLFNFFLLLTGCFSNWKAVDIDGDGISALEGDCWDSPESPPQVEGALEHNLGPGDIFVGAEDLPYDGIDANCDGLDDFDADGDGWVPAEYAGIPTFNVAGTGLDQNIGDCWDDPDVLLETQNGFEALAAVDVNKGVEEERWYDGIDQNCDGNSDFDQDADGQDTTDYGAGLDCNDLDLSIFDGATEIFYDGIDQDCREGDDCDADLDGYPSSETGLATDVCPMVEDCDDTNPAVYPDPTVAEIYYNGLDDDCNPQTGDGDADVDGYWSIDYEDIAANAGFEPLVDPNNAEPDCWDADVNDPEYSIPTAYETQNGFPQLNPFDVYPGADDQPYDAVDADCLGGDDFDADGDGYASSAYGMGEDCFDSEVDHPDWVLIVPPFNVNPAMPEIWYDGVDSDCNGESDFDQDEDGFDSAAQFNPASGFGSDCDDVEWSVYPNAPEIVNDGIDQDCDSGDTCFVDADSDGFRNVDTSLTVGSTDLDCDDAGEGTVSEPATDCNDAVPSIFPGAPEVLDDAIDQDCDNGDSCYVDGDSDGFRNVDTSLSVGSSDLDCDDLGEGSSAEPATDCDDNEEDTHPGAAELDSATACMRDLDLDGYGDASTSGSIVSGQDCDDTNELINPLSTEDVDNGVDQNCDGIELCYTDADSDGFRNQDVGLTVDSTDLDCDDAGEGSSLEPATDCDDNDPQSYPGAPEIVSDGIDQDCDTEELCFIDADSDGFRNVDTSLTMVSTDLFCDGVGEGDISEPNTDCNDLIATIHPGAPEVIDDGIDQDCDSGDSCYLDADSDGFRHVDTSLSIGSSDLDCDDSGEGSSSEPATDCDDGDNSIYPNATEVIDDGIDQDCVAGDICYVDNDSDGFRNQDTTLTVVSLDLDCDDAGEGSTGELATDCDDSTNSIYPGAPEVLDDGIDQDCDAGDSCFVDADSDGFRSTDTSLSVGSLDLDCNDAGEGRSSEPATDCNDSDSTIFPGTIELVDDGVDQNCDTDELCFMDNDSDGFRNPNTSLTVVSSDLDCDDSGEGSSSEPATDCDDNANSIYPNAPEVVDDGIDQDCDSGDLCYVDGDNDGFRTIDTSLTIQSSDLSCTGTGEGSSGEPATDCNDSDGGINPNAVEIVDDGIDQDCDSGDSCYADADSDGFRNTDTSLRVSSTDLDCNDSGEGATGEPATDCDDTESTTFPGAAEVVDDGIDQDCAQGDVCYVDNDNDGYRNQNTSLTIVSSDLDCNDPGEGRTSEPSTDCNDGDNTIYPGAPEVVDDGVDQDCHLGDVCYVDSDSDNYRSLNTSLTVESSDLDCNDSGEGLTAEPATDCDDADPLSYPGAAEIIADGINQDCSDGDLCYVDNDSDGYRNQDTSLTVVSSDLDCNDAGEGSGNEPATDCDDTEATVYPGAPEVVDDGIDQDCDAGDSCYVDFDNDGFRTTDTSLTVDSVDLDCDDSGEAPNSFPATDCDDGSNVIYPNAPEVIDDGVDQNCSGGDLCYLDSDSDGFRNQNTSLTTVSGDLDCDDSGEGSSNEPATDCDDTQASIYPSAPEVIDDGVDQNCDNGDTCYVDSDNDNFRTTDTSLSVDSSDLDCDDLGEGSSLEPATDCNDSDPGINPGAVNVVNDGINQDCSDGDLCYVDFDNDGYRTLDTSLTVQSFDLDCTDSGEAVSSDPATDCDDTDNTINPNGVELVADGVDQDCNNQELCYVDFDNDGYRTPDTSLTVQSSDLDCTGNGEGEASDPASDCNDAIASINPGASEVVDDGIDQNCDNGDVCYVDSDDDGYRTIDTNLTIDSSDLDCTDPGEAESTDFATDCDDGNNGVYPEATEIIGDGVDQDCDAAEICYVDSDDDGFRTLDVSVTIASSDTDCNDSGEAVVGDPATDCDDASNTVNPGASEVVGDGIDQDCDAAEICYVDNDNDGFRTINTSVTLVSSDLDCTDTGESQSSDPASDCDDADPFAFPGAAEIESLSSCRRDADEDGYGDDSPANGAVASGLDCNDNADDEYPDAPEFYNDGVDGNCDGLEAVNVECEGDTIINSSNESVYILRCDEVDDFFTLDDLCVTHGYEGQASVYDALEDAALVDFSTNAGLTDSMWIGLVDINNNGVHEYHWYQDQTTVVWSGDSTGSSPNGLYTNWLGGQPSNSSENCVEVVGTGINNTGKWNDVACNSSRGMTCEARY